jgi:outer membrane protein assembly factor BamA
MKLKFFGIGRDTVIISNDHSNYVWTSQAGMDVSLNCFRKIYKGLFGGLEYRYNASNLKGSDSLSEAILNCSGLPTGRITESVFIPAFIWDNRDNIFWSAKGYYASISFQFSNSVVIKSRDYGVLAGWVNGYHNLVRSSKKLILAWHFYGQSGRGDLPYSRYATFGQGDEVTGYTRGKYVNNSELSIQAELRYEIWKFISCGGYAGTGKVFPGFNVFGQSAWLHFGGLRLYLNIIPSRNIRLRIDGAIARKDWGIYVGIGQAF